MGVVLAIFNISDSFIPSIDFYPPAEEFYREGGASVAIPSKYLAGRAS